VLPQLPQPALVPPKTVPIAVSTVALLVIVTPPPLVAVATISPVEEFTFKVRVTAAAAAMAFWYAFIAAILKFTFAPLILFNVNVPLFEFAVIS
jgi:hypothetical protein